MLNFIQWWKRVFKVISVICITILFFSAIFAALKATYWLNIFVDQTSQEYIASKEAQPLWMRIKDLGYKDYTIDQKNRLVTIRF